MKTLLLSLALAVSISTTYSQPQQRWDPFLDTLQTRTLQWFLDTTPASTGLAPDRWPAAWSPSSIAAIGFALTSYPIAAERKLVTRREAASRVL
ncbi:MAG: Tat pathway signal protein, partial [bacterium]